MNYKIYPMNAGENAAPFDMNLLIYRYPIGREQYSIGNGFFAVQNENGKWFLVDAGTGCNDELEHMGKPLMVNAKSFFELLAEKKIDPNGIEAVIVTHLHWDHVHNLDKLPNAKFYVQKAEIPNAVCPGKHERTTYGFMGVQGFTTPKWMTVADHMVAIEGEREVLPGVRCIPTPGHTPGSQSVLIDTAKGTYALVGDQYYFIRNVLEDALIGVFENHASWYASHDKLRHLVDPGKIITTHDPVTYEHECYG
jgi:glyoxylase-like metal-dependent hydrolase (beta-lactamase superfamily II)